MTVEEVAKVCHEANRAYCFALKDFSQMEWHCADEWQRESAIAGVRYCLNYPERTQASVHEEWMRHKIEQGWKHGPVKDAEKKEHPCMVPYDQLPHDQRIKDELFSAIVNILKPLIGRVEE